VYRDFNGDGDYNTFVDIGENSGADKDGGTSNGAAND
jgi:hypothetical protein